MWLLSIYRPNVSDRKVALSAIHSQFRGIDRTLFGRADFVDPVAISPATRLVKQNGSKVFDVLV